MKAQASSHSADLRVRLRAVSERLSLPLKLGLRGSSGNVPGSGAGSSIDFQDHRPYVPGDDPRHIDWQAYARSGHYSMKLYREEVRPLADIVFDVSPSMALNEAKSLRSLELAAFCLESALRSGASVRLFTAMGETITPLDLAAHLEIPDAGSATAPPALHRIPWRAASLRVVISDLLYPAAPESLIAPLLSSRGRAILFVPWCGEESDPDWLGNTDLRDCETGTRRDLRFHVEDLRHYGSIYQNHFTLWRTETRRHGIPLARVSSAGDIIEALSAEGIPSGAVQIL